MAEADAPATCPEGHVGAGGSSPSSPPPDGAPPRAEACAARRWPAGAAAAAPAAERTAVTLSSWDDYPVHQAAEFIAHPATRDRNFYDRYYFNMHPCSRDWFAIFGFGQYPNLGVVDAFVDVRRAAPSTSSAPRPRGRPGRPLGGPVPDRGARAAAAPAVRGGADRAPRRHGRHLGGPHPRRRPSPASTCAPRAGWSSTPSAWPRRGVVGDAHGGRDRHRRHPGALLGHPRPLLGGPPGRRARARRHP